MGLYALCFGSHEVDPLAFGLLLLMSMLGDLEN